MATASRCMADFENGENAVKNIFRLSIVGVVGLILLIVLLNSCERINVGYVGIKVNLAGAPRGAESVPTVSGYVLYSPFISQVLEYPVFVQTARWEGGEQISFNSSEGLVLTADISLSFQLRPEKVPSFYTKFRSDDIDKFTHGFLRNVTRDAFNDVAGASYTAEQILGQRKEELLKRVSERLNAALAGIGIEVQQLGFLNVPRPPDSVTNAITAKITATQQAVQVENELRRTKAEAEKRIAAAEGEAKSKITIAEADARVRVTAADADAKANQLLTKSLSPELLEWQRLQISREGIQKWNGVRPQVEGAGAGLMLQLPVK